MVGGSDVCFLGHLGMLLRCKHGHGTNLIWINSIVLQKRALTQSKLVQKIESESTWICDQFTQVLFIPTKSNLLTCKTTQNQKSNVKLTEVKFL